MHRERPDAWRVMFNIIYASEKPGYAKGIATARRNADRAAVKINAIVGSEDAYGTERWDLIVFVYEPFPITTAAYVERLHRSLRPGGLIVIEGFGEEETVKNRPTGHRSWTLACRLQRLSPSPLSRCGRGSRLGWPKATALGAYGRRKAAIDAKTGQHSAVPAGISRRAECGAGQHGGCPDLSGMLRASSSASNSAAGT
jgi:hypothetical protein